MSDAQGVSLLTPSSPSLHMQSKIAQASVKGPVQLWPFSTAGILNFWGKEAGQELGGIARGCRHLSKAGAPSKGGDVCRYDPSDQSRLQGCVVSYCNSWLLEYD